MSRFRVSRREKSHLLSICARIRRRYSSFQNKLPPYNLVRRHSLPPSEGKADEASPRCSFINNVGQFGITFDSISRELTRDRGRAIELCKFPRARSHPPRSLASFLLTRRGLPRLHPARSIAQNRPKDLRARTSITSSRRFHPPDKTARKKKRQQQQQQQQPTTEDGEIQLRRLDVPIIRAERNSESAKFTNSPRARKILQRQKLSRVSIVDDADIRCTAISPRQGQIASVR